MKSSLRSKERLRSPACKDSVSGTACCSYALFLLVDEIPATGSAAKFVLDLLFGCFNQNTILNQVC